MSHSMRRSTRITALFAALALSGSLAAFDWPVDSPLIKTSFGSIRSERFEPGVQIAAEGSHVKAADSGEILFSSDGKGPIPGGLGAWVAVAHEDGFVSLYGRLEPNSLPAGLLKVERGDFLGMTGKSGAATGPGLEFMILDSLKDAWVNPCSFLPKVEDQTKPQIAASWIRRDSVPIPLGQGTRVRQGLCELRSEIFDLDSRRVANAPYSVRVVLSGSEKIGLTWDILRCREGRIRLFEDRALSVEEFGLGEDAYILGSFYIPRGKMGMDVIVSDYAQNTKSVSYQIIAE